MKKVSSLLTVASGLFALIPGVAILTSNIGVPPNASRALFAGTIETLGIITLLILWVNKKRIEQLSNTSITRISVITTLVFLLSLFTYLFIYNYFVVEIPNTNSLFFPMWSEGELKMYLQKLGSRTELINQWGRDDVYKVIQSSSKTPLICTTLLFLMIYQLIFVSLTVTFGLLGIKGSLEDDANVRS